MEALRQRGFPAFTARDEQMIQVDDATQLAFAAARGWMILTHNGRHFRALHRSWLDNGLEHSGIIVLPERPPFERLVIRAAITLSWIRTLPHLRDGFFVWGEVQEQLEGGVRWGDFTDEAVRLALGRL